MLGIRTHQMLEAAAEEKETNTFSFHIAKPISFSIILEAGCFSAP